MANREIEAILRISAKQGSMAAFDKVAGKLRMIEAQTAKLNRSQSFMAIQGGRAARVLNATAAASVRYIGGAMAAYGGAAAVKEFAAVERRLTRTGLVLGATKEQMRELNVEIGQNAKSYALSSDAVMDTVDAYAAAGASLSEIKADLPLLAKAQQALDAAGADTVATWDAARKSLKLTSSDAQRFFELVGAGGAAGKFEGKDMAAELPSLLPVAARVGMHGTKDAASMIGFLEVMADYAGSAGQAATSTRDLLEKINSPDVIKNFKKFKIDIVGGMEDARKNGEDLFVALNRFISRATGGDAKKLGFLFGDKEARAAAGVVLTKLDEIRRAQDEVAANAPGILDRNVDAVLDNAQAKLDRMWETLKHLGRAGGEFLVDSGIVGAGENVADAMDRSTAINATLAQQGVTGEWAVLKHIMGKAADFGFNRERLREYEDFLARQSGWDGGDPLMKHASELADRRKQMEAHYGSPNPVRRNKRGMPINPPLPTPRPTSPAEEARAAQVWASGYDRLADARGGESASKAGRRDDEERAAALDSFLDAGRRFREEAAQAANTIGEQGGSTFARMLEGVGAQLGREAAQAFRAAVGTIDVRPRSGAGVTGDIGQMPPTGGYR